MYFDIIIILMVVILALKGLFTGLVRELCSVFGIIGGVLLASRFNVALGGALNSLLKIESPTLVNLIGFVAILGVLWILALVLAEILVRFVRFIKLGVADKIGGVGVAGIKVFLILSIIFFTFSKINFLSNWTLKLRDSSALYPVMIKIGDFIVKTDFATEMRENLTEQGKNAVNEIMNSVDSANRTANQSTDSANRTNPKKD
ncbi:CvpA family protein [Helicobacter sp. 23-1045]